MPTGSSDYLNYPQVLPFFLTGRQTDPFRLCVNYRGPYNVPGHVGFDGQNGHDSHVSLDSHDRSYAPRQAGKGLTLLEDFCWLTLVWFFTFSNADIWFAGRELIWMTYTAAGD